MESSLKDWKKILDREYPKLQAAKAQVAKEQEEIDRLKKEIAATSDAQSLIQRTAADCQQRVHQKIAAVVSKCLSTIFDDPYSLQIDFVSKRGKTEAVLSFSRDGEKVDPLDAAGGGVVDIAAFALRVAAVLCSRPSLRKVIILDEPFKHIHVDKVPLIGAMLESLSEETGIQFILVTQLPKLCVGRIIDLAL